MSVYQDYGGAAAAGAAAAGLTAGAQAVNPFVQVQSVSTFDAVALISNTFGPRAANPDNLPVWRVNQMRDTLVGRDPYLETQNAANPLGRVQGLFPGFGDAAEPERAPTEALSSTVNAVNQLAFQESLQRVDADALPSSGDFALRAVAAVRPATRAATYLDGPVLGPPAYVATTPLQKVVAAHHGTAATLLHASHAEHFTPRAGESMRAYHHRVDPLATFDHVHQEDGEPVHPHFLRVKELVRHHNAEARDRRISIGELARLNLQGHGHAPEERAFYAAVQEYAHENPGDTQITENVYSHAFRKIAHHLSNLGRPVAQRMNPLLTDGGY